MLQKRKVCIAKIVLHYAAVIKWFEMKVFHLGLKKYTHTQQLGFRIKHSGLHERKLHVPSMRPRACLGLIKHAFELKRCFSKLFRNLTLTIRENLM